MLPGEIVTTFKPAPGALGGGCDGPTGACNIAGAGGGVTCTPTIGALVVGLVPDVGALTAGQLALEATLRTGRGGALGIAFF